LSLVYQLLKLVRGLTIFLKNFTPDYPEFFAKIFPAFSFLPVPYFEKLFDRNKFNRKI